MNDKWLLNVGIFCVLIIGSLFIINSKLSKEINQSVAPATIAAPAVVERQKASPKAEKTPQLVEIAETPSKVTASVKEANEKFPSENEKKIIYELPLDDVILVQ